MSHGANPLFIDTGAFYALFDEDDQHHGQVSRIFDAIQNGDLAYRPLFTSQAVLSELATLILYRTGHAEATGALGDIRKSASINVLMVDKPTFGSAVERFGEYDDHDISLVDHTTGVRKNRAMPVVRIARSRTPHAARARPLARRPRRRPGSGCRPRVRRGSR